MPFRKSRLKTPYDIATTRLIFGWKPELGKIVSAAASQDTESRQDGEA